ARTSTLLPSMIPIFPRRRADRVEPTASSISPIPPATPSITVARCRSLRRRTSTLPAAQTTLCHTIDDGTFVTFVSTPQSNAQRNLERANSNQDARHRFVANFVADTPDHGLLRYFELSSIVTLQSARPFTLFVGFDANNDGNPVTDRVGNSPRNSYRGDTLKTVDMRLSRTFHLSERKRLALSFDAFNIFNRANVDEVFSVYGAPDFIPGE